MRAFARTGGQVYGVTLVALSDALPRLFDCVPQTNEEYADYCDDEHHVLHCAAFIENGNDPKPVVEQIKKLTKVYPYKAGGVGTPIAEQFAGGPRQLEGRPAQASGLYFWQPA